MKPSKFIQPRVSTSKHSSHSRAEPVVAIGPEAFKNVAINRIISSPPTCTPGCKERSREQSPKITVRPKRLFHQRKSCKVQTSSKGLPPNIQAYLGSIYSLPDKPSTSSVSHRTKKPRMKLYKQSSKFERPSISTNNKFEGGEGEVQEPKAASQSGKISEGEGLVVGGGNPAEGTLSDSAVQPPEKPLTQVTSIEKPSHASLTFQVAGKARKSKNRRRRSPDYFIDQPKGEQWQRPFDSHHLNRPLQVNRTHLEQATSSHIRALNEILPSFEKQQRKVVNSSVGNRSKMVRNHDITGKQYGMSQKLLNIYFNHVVSDKSFYSTKSFNQGESPKKFMHRRHKSSQRASRPLGQFSKTKAFLPSFAQSQEQIATNSTERGQTGHDGLPVDRSMTKNSQPSIRNPFAANQPLDCNSSAAIQESDCNSQFVSKPIDGSNLSKMMKGPPPPLNSTEPVFVQNPQLSAFEEVRAFAAASRTSGGNVSPHFNSQMNSASKPFSNYKEARKFRLEKQVNVQKLQKRIIMLEKEQNKAMKRIEDTRTKAFDLLKTKIEKDEFNRRLTELRETHLMRAQEIVQATNNERENIRFQKNLLEQKNKQLAMVIKSENESLKKQRHSNERTFLRKVQERRFEFQVQAEASRLKCLQMQKDRAAAISMVKDQQLSSEAKRIQQNMKQTRKLERAEIEVLEKLKQTYAKQQETIEEIQGLLNNPSLEETEQHNTLSQREETKGDESQQQPALDFSTQPISLGEQGTDKAPSSMENNNILLSDPRSRQDLSAIQIQEGSRSTASPVECPTVGAIPLAKETSNPSEVAL